MNRVTTICLLGGLAACLGLSSDGCTTGIEIGPGGRPAPAILTTTPPEDSRRRVFEVDLRRYPETHRMTWDFGDGVVLTGLPVERGRAVTHDFVDDGTFVVTVYLFSAGNPIAKAPPQLVATGHLPIDILGANTAPIASFVVQEVTDDQGVTAALAKRFVASASRDPDGTIARYRWEFGDGSQGDGPIVEHTFSRSGRFPVRLRVTDDRGGQATATLTVLVNSLPAASFTFEGIGGNGLQFRFDGSGSNDADGEVRSFAWDFGDGTPAGSGPVVTHTYAVPDNYIVTLTVTDAFGASTSTTQTLDVTGVSPFLRSVTPAFGVTDTAAQAVVIDGENFQSGATVRIERGGASIVGTAVNVSNAQTLSATFDLTGAALGDYDVIVDNPDTTTATLAAGFRVVTSNRVRLTTSLGDIVMELVDDAPITTDNFLQYVEDDFYDGTIFHRVVVDFIIQGGGFLPGMVPQTGQRGPIQNEFSPTRSNVRGTVAMAKLGNDPDSATSEFFVNLADNSANLDNQNGGFTVFATVVEGMDVVDAIAAVPLDGSTPIDDVILIRAERE